MNKKKINTVYQTIDAEVVTEDTQQGKRVEFRSAKLKVPHENKSNHDVSHA